MCTKDNFPFNTIDDDYEFMEAVYDLKPKSSTLLFVTVLSSDRVYSPFELNEVTIDIPLLDNDPDVL